jgi:ligand-binding sensor domain-containing protein
MADGSLWLAMTDQLLHARPEENQWVLASLPESVVGMVEYIEAAADDSLWLQTQNPSAVYRCTP